jgi:general secretion pathway protein L
LETLFIRIGAPAHQVVDTWILESVSWVVLDDSGQAIKHGTGDARDLADLVGADLRRDPDRVVAVVPGELCLSLQVTVPGRSIGQIRRALPFVIEEYLASDIDQVHIAHGPISRHAPVDCVAVERTLMQGWCAALATVGITPGVLLCEAELLPYGEDTISVFFDDQRILVRTPSQSLVAEPDMLPLALAGAIEQITGDAPVTVHCIDGTVSELDRAQIDQSSPVPLIWDHTDTGTPGFLALARQWQRGSPITDLLQGEFAAQRRQSPYWQQWRTVAALAGLWFVIALSVQLGQAVWAEYRAAQLDRTVRAAYQSYFPDDPNVGIRSLDGIRSQLAQHVGAGTGHSGFLTLTGVLAESLPEGGGTSLRGITYNDARFELAVDLTAPDFAALDQLRDRLAATGLSVDISSAEQQEQHVRARLRLRG